LIKELFSKHKKVTYQNIKQLEGDTPNHLTLNAKRFPRM